MVNSNLMIQRHQRPMVEPTPPRKLGDGDQKKITLKAEVHRCYFTIKRRAVSGASDR